MLQKKVVWITGSSRGIGRATALHLSQLGARVAIHGTSENSPGYFGTGSTLTALCDQISSQTQHESMSVVGDLTSETEVSRCATEIRSRWGRIDILICAAGGNISAGGLSDNNPGLPKSDTGLGISTEDFHSVINRNLWTTILCCREVAPEMVKRKSGVIVTLGSTAGCGTSYFQGMQGRGAAYCTAKAAIHAFTRSLALELRPFDIPVVCVAPGNVPTERVYNAYVSAANSGNHRQTVTGSLEGDVDVDSVAELIGFLLSPSGKYLSGEIVRVCGARQFFPC